MEQQCTKLKNSAKQWKPYIKLLFIFWLFASIYLLANYKSVQAYFLMTSQTGPNNILDLINKGYKIQVWKKIFEVSRIGREMIRKRECEKAVSKKDTPSPNWWLALWNSEFYFQIERDDFFNIKRHCQYYNTSGTCSLLLGKLKIFDNNLCGAIEKVLNDKIALIQEEESLKYTVCLKYKSWW